VFKYAMRLSGAARIVPTGPVRAVSQCACKPIRVLGSGTRLVLVSEWSSAPTQALTQLPTPGTCH
jgi:hypothetical protein